MVWFQCEDCGENLKKPKLPNHFRICSAGKLSCIDCGETFNQQTVQGHTQCITEAEKYGPKGQAKSPHCAQSKPSKPKQDVDFDIHVGLSSRPPWFCSLCNTKTTSQQTLLSHADGKKHRAKARAFHAAQKPPSQQDGSVQNKDNADDTTTIKVDDGKCINKQEDKMSDKQSCALIAEVETDSLPSKRRKLDAPDVVDPGYNMDNHPADLSNGEVVQAEKVTYSQINTKKNKCDADKNGLAEEAPKKKIKWKKLATSILKSDSDGVMKLKKLEKHVRRTLKGSGISVNEAELHEKLIDKVSSSSRFVIENKHIRLVAKAGSA